MCLNCAWLNPHLCRERPSLAAAQKPESWQHLCMASSAACSDISGVQEHFPPLPMANYPLKAELESLGLVFFSLLTCSQWMLLQLEEGSCTRLWVISGLATRSLPQLGKISLIFRASVSPFPTDMINSFLHAETVFSLKQRLSWTASCCVIDLVGLIYSMLMNSYINQWDRTGLGF